jgi:hypothetical protein
MYFKCVLYPVVCVYPVVLRLSTYYIYIIKMVVKLLLFYHITELQHFVLFCKMPSKIKHFKEVRIEDFTTF